MTARTLKSSDIPLLNKMAEASGFPYPDLESPSIEAVSVVVDDEDQPIMAVAAVRIVELYFWCGQQKPAPHASVAAIRMLHDSMAEELRTKGYNEANSFLPPSVSGSFGRRLERTFGWVKNWPSWAKRF